MNYIKQAYHSYVVLSLMMLPLPVLGAALSSVGLSSRRLTTQQMSNNTLCEAIVNKEPLEHIKKHIAAGADVNSVNEQGEVPLICACRRGNVDVVQYLLDQGARIQQDRGCITPLSVSRRGVIAELLLENGADPNGAYLGKSELMIAAEHLDDPDKMWHLLKNGSRINDCTSVGENALYFYVVSSSTFLKDPSSLDLRQGIRSYSGDYREILPAIRVFLWNGACVTAETFAWVQQLIEKFPSATRGSRQHFIHQKLIGIQEMLLNPYKKGGRLILIRELSSTNNAQHALINPSYIQLQKKRSTNIFLNLARREIGKKWEARQVSGIQKESTESIKSLDMVNNVAVQGKKIKCCTTLKNPYLAGCILVCSLMAYRIITDMPLMIR